MKTLADFTFRELRTLVRVDFNVPLNESGEILDDFKIQQTLPTITWLQKAGAKIILTSHLGDPRGRVEPRLRLDRIQAALEEKLQINVVKVPDCRGQAARGAIQLLEPGEIVLLENLRFHAEEEAGDLGFARELASLADVFVNDAFAVCHRFHASLLVPRFLPSAAGLLLEKEVRVLTGLRDHPLSPLVVILAGQAKGLETKLNLINRFSARADFILLGGLVGWALQEARSRLVWPDKVIFPLGDNRARDVSAETLALFRDKIAMARTVFWSGPLGRVEDPAFQEGTREIAQAIIASQSFSVVGGGDTLSFLKNQNLLNGFSHVSTGGDALLAFLAGEDLPGIAELERNPAT